MIKKVIYILAILVGSLLFNGCEQTKEVQDFSQPTIESSVEKNIYTVGGESITTGPLKDYETDSEVIYKLLVTSEKTLSKFMVSSSSDAISQMSRIVKTEPDGVIDEKGNFTKNLNEVVIYYAYHIHPLVAASSSVTVTFSILNSNNNASSAIHTFSVIKKGSTNGQLLNVIDFQYTNTLSRGIGTQDALLDESEGTRPEGQGTRSGPLFSFKNKVGLTNCLDAIANPDNIDFVGYQTRSAGTDPVLVTNSYYLVSPSDTSVLTSSFAGAVTASFQLQGSSGTANIIFAGLTKLATFKTNTTTTATDFVTAHKTAYAAVGLTLSASSGKLIWTATRKSAAIEPVKATTLTGNLNGVNEVTKVLRKNMIMRTTIRQMDQKLKSQGKGLRVVYFKRLDNITGPNQVTPADFDILTHDNEFDTLLAGIQEEGKTLTAALDLDQVYGFVMSDGKRGLLRTAPVTVFLDGNNVSVVKPNASNWILWGMIKYQDAK